MIKERIEQAKEELLASTSVEFDLQVKGMVRAFREILDWEPEVSTEEDDDGHV